MSWGADDYWVMTSRADGCGVMMAHSSQTRIVGKVDGHCSLVAVETCSLSAQCTVLWTGECLD